MCVCVCARVCVCVYKIIAFISVIFIGKVRHIRVRAHKHYKRAQVIHNLFVCTVTVIRHFGVVNRGPINGHKRFLKNLFGAQRLSLLGIITGFSLFVLQEKSSKNFSSIVPKLRKSLMKLTFRNFTELGLRGTLSRGRRQNVSSYLFL